MTKNKLESFMSLLEQQAESFSKNVEYLKRIVENYKTDSPNQIHNKVVFQTIPSEYMETAFKVVAAHFNFTMEEIMNCGTNREKTRIKHIVAYIANKVHSVSQDYISDFFKISQPSINVSIHKIEGELSVYPKTKKEIEFLTDKIVLEINYLIN